MEDKMKGLLLALSSTVLIGSSFIVKKKGLRKAAATGVRAGSGGYSYLSEPLWWAGMISMILGEVANFAAYAFAPPILVTPLGALSVFISAVLSHILLNEKLHVFGWLGCVLCVTGSTTIVLHAPPERPIESVHQLWELALDPSFIVFAVTILFMTGALIFHFAPKYGQTNVLIYIGICSLLGSISVMSCKALGIAIKLTLYGDNQLFKPETAAFAIVLALCGMTQISYLNRALDTFNTAVVSPIYYVMFTTATLIAAVIMFKEWDIQTSEQMMSQACGFVTILCGTFLLHATRDHADGPIMPTTRSGSSSVAAKSNTSEAQGHEGKPLLHP